MSRVQCLVSQSQLHRPPHGAAGRRRSFPRACSTTAAFSMLSLAAAMLCCAPASARSAFQCFGVTNEQQVGATSAASPEAAYALAASAIPLTQDETGFAPVADAIGDARILLLGEPWHGDGAAMLHRAHLVQYLHEHHGFDVLVFEADFFALHRGWEAVQAGAAPSAMAADNIYSFWSQTAVMRELWAYIDAKAVSERPLQVAGIDTKVMGALTIQRLSGELREQLESIMGGDEAAKAADTLHRLLSPRPDDKVSHAEFAALQVAVTRLEDALRAGDRPSSFWAQMAQSLRRQLSGEARDLGMAENLIWLATQLYPDRKFIVWAHNNHIMTDKWMLYDAAGPDVAAVIGQESLESIGRRTYLGEAVRAYFGHRATYALGLITGTGEYSTDIGPALYGRAADFTKTESLAFAGPGTLEAALAARGHRVAFVDLPCQDTGPVSTRVIDYSLLPPLPLNIAQGFDGLIYVDTTHGLETIPRTTR